MRFFKIQGDVRSIDTGLLADDDTMPIREQIREWEFTQAVQDRTETFFEKRKDQGFITLARVTTRSFTLCLIVENEANPVELSKSYLKEIGVRPANLSAKETTFEEYSDLLSNADRRDYVREEEEVYRAFGLRSVSDRCFRRINFVEDILNIKTYKDIEKGCKELLTARGLQEEIRRIKQSHDIIDIQGHPVHYLVQSDDSFTKDRSCFSLLAALYKNKRISNRRICHFSSKANHDVSMQCLDTLFKMNSGGAIVVDFENIEGAASYYASEELDIAEKICSCLKKYRNEVLVIIRLPKVCVQVKNYLFENLGSLSFVEIDEDPADERRAKQLLRAWARKKGIDADNAIFQKLEKGQTYLTQELRVLFEEWFSKKLKSEIFPQYSAIADIKTQEVSEEAKGSGYSELMSMIGLEHAKAEIQRAIDFHKMQKFLAAKEIDREHPSMHMVFTGNPGTAKTTVARLFARVMRENELLSSGHIVEVGRGDLVGRFVGHTAPLVKNVFKKARGGILFIDEAYALVDDRDGCFGDEAINTIVQEMENRRDDLVVIFAGYPDKMEQFLQKNPGLRSRISFHVPFPDYNEEELLEIAAKIASEKGMNFGIGVEDKLLNIFSAARKESDFGNGRFARTTIEKAMMAQASRLVNSDLENATKGELNTILPEDVETPEMAKKQQIALGFCA